MTGGIEWGIVQGSRLKALRLHKGFSQAYVANKIAYTKASVTGWELGKNRPSFKALHDLAFLYNVPIEYITEGNMDGVPDGVTSARPAETAPLALVSDQSIISNGAKGIVRIMAMLSGGTEKDIIEAAIKNYARTVFDWQTYASDYYFNNDVGGNNNVYSEKQ